MRELAKFESDNLAFLTRYGVDFALIEPTAMGLAKAILDATAEYRQFLLRNQVHDYQRQMQGDIGKVYIPANLLLGNGEAISTRASLYRPKTKNGDPRIWFSRLQYYCRPNEILVSVYSDNQLLVLNASSVNFAEAFSVYPNYKRLLKPLVVDRELIFEELLERLQELSSRGFIPLYKSADTGAGHMLETELGIRQNSSRDPDYKGIEIKSSRAPALQRSNLFAKVADWEISQLKGPRELLDNFGYYRDGEWKLNCTVSGASWNSQGLKFRVDEKTDLLHMISRESPIRVPETWRMSTLRHRLAAKHADTFWVTGDSRMEGDVERVHFTTAVQTSKPIVQQLGPMLSAGTVTMDHLMTIRGDRGPEFKVSKRHAEELFPDPIFHDLLRGETVQIHPFRQS